MLPIKTRTVFKSRWMALLWAGGIVWSAAEFAGSQPHRASSAPANGADQSGNTAAPVATDVDGNPISPADVAAAKAAVAAFGK
jgi:hypothetical protein